MENNLILNSVVTHSLAAVSPRVVLVFCSASSGVDFQGDSVSRPVPNDLEGLHQLISIRKSFQGV